MHQFLQSWPQWGVDAPEGHERAAKSAARLPIHQQPAVSQLPDDGEAGQPGPQAISAGMPFLAAPPLKSSKQWRLPLTVAAPWLCHYCSFCSCFGPVKACQWARMQSAALYLHLHVDLEECA